MSSEEVLKLGEKISAADLLQFYFDNVERVNRQDQLFYEPFFKALDLGVLPAKIYLTMYRHRRVFKTVEMASRLGQGRSHVYVAFTDLEKAGLVTHITKEGRTSRGEWILRE